MESPGTVAAPGQGLLRMTHLCNVTVVLNFSAELRKMKSLIFHYIQKEERHITSRLRPFKVGLSIGSQPWLNLTSFEMLREFVYINSSSNREKAKQNHFCLLALFQEFFYMPTEFPI